MDVLLSDVRLSFPNLFEPKAFKPGDPLRYDATFLVEPGSNNDRNIRAEIQAEATRVFGKKAPALLAQWEGNNQKLIYYSGDLKEYDGYAGMMALACHSKVRPMVLNFDKTPLTAQDGKPYAGCYVHAKVSIYGMSGANPGIFASFSNVMFSRDGDAFGGGVPPSQDDFDGLLAGAMADDLV